MDIYSPISSAAIASALAVSPLSSLTLATGATNNFRIGQWGGAATFSALSFNNDLTSAGMAGLIGGGDNAVYYMVPTGLAHHLRVNNIDTFVVAGATAQLFSSAAVPAGGTAGLGLTFSSTSNLGVFFGSGVPTLSAAQGSLYVRTDGSSTSTRIYVNTNGTTGWTNVTTAT